MYLKTTTISNETGLHARPAAAFVQEAKKYSCDICIRNIDKGNDAVNGKSLLRVMGAELVKGSTIEISADGKDEQNAVNALIALVDSGIGD